MDSKTTNKENRNKLIDTENPLVFARWEGVGRIGEKGEGIKTYMLPVIVTVVGWKAQQRAYS